MIKIVKKIGWAILALNRKLFYKIEWYFSEERKDPYRCTDCGSAHVQLKVWSEVNSGGRYAGDCEEFDRCYCEDCDNPNVRIRHTSSLLNDANAWWENADIPAKASLCGFVITDSPGSTGSLDLKNICDHWWNKLTSEQKIRYSLK